MRATASELPKAADHSVCRCRAYSDAAAAVHDAAADLAPFLSTDLSLRQLRRRDGQDAMLIARRSCTCGGGCA